MTYDDTTIDEVRSILESFVQVLDDEYDDPREIELVLRGETTLSIADFDSGPEEWTEDILVEPLIDAVGLNKSDGRPHSKFKSPEWVSGREPDFGLDNFDDLGVIGENKSVNRIEVAEGDIEEYLSAVWWPNNGIATDGIEWTIYHLGSDQGGEDGKYRSFTKRISLRDAALAIAADAGYIGGTYDIEAVNEQIETFVQHLHPEGLASTFQQDAPRSLRDEWESEVKDFYELYIELLFGESSEYEDRYDTCLRDDIIVPDSVPDNEVDEQKDLFAVTLVNRLLFIKFLEKRGVLRDDFLIERVEAYDENLPQSLYKTVFEPLFYDLLNTPKPRPEPLDSGWQENVPYLNGGLFRENVTDESKFDVVTRTLPVIVTDLIEGQRGDLDFDIDPAILGSVFERTINHIGGEGVGKQQASTGAYYTPEDVTHLINERTVQPKLRDEVIAAFEQAVEQPAEFRAEAEDKSLDEMLVRIEEGRGYFGREEGIESALSRLRDLTVLDPACGSGHFLTAAFDELHRAQLSLLKGKHGRSLDDETKYQAKKQLALNTIYGVDVEPAGVEIAKLRVWLKIIEDGWNDEFGRLPNIDMNIAEGNSLVGFPITGERTATLDMPDIQEQIKEALARRLRYRNEDEGERKDIERLMNEEIRPVMNEAFVDSISTVIETEITEPTEIDNIANSIEQGPLHTRLQSLKVQREDGAALTESQLERLSEAGFEYDEWRDTNKSARLTIKERERDTSHGEEWSTKESIFRDLRSLLDDGFVFTSVERQPLTADLEQILSRTFHWPVEFPEVTFNADLANGATEIEDLELSPEDVGFDIILGNPPYGNLTNDSEDMLSHTYRMHKEDISALFVERQIDLLDKGGYFGNITTLGLTYQTSMEPLHDMIRTNLANMKVSCFGLRGRQGVFKFDSAKIRVAIFTGKMDPGNSGEIETSDLIVFNEDNRQERFNNIEHGSTEGLILRDSIGGSGSRGPVLPKVGADMKRNILIKLRDCDDRLFDDIYEKGGGEHALYRPDSGGYWINPRLEPLQQLSSKWEEIAFGSEAAQKFAFLVLNSSLYYLHYITYGNQRDHQWVITKGFPVPEESAIEQNREQIISLADTVWREMKNGFTQTGKTRGRFNMGALRPLVDEIDALLGELYGLTDEEIEYTQNYFADFEDGSCRTGAQNKTLSDYDLDPVTSDD